MKIDFFLIILSQLYILIKCGQVSGQDNQIVYNSTGYVHQIKMAFKLDNQLSTSRQLISQKYNSHLYITFPFDLGSSKDIVARLSTYGKTDYTVGTVYKDRFDFYFEFNVGINKDTWMNLQITVGKIIQPSDYRNQPVIFRTCPVFKFVNNRIIDDIIIYDQNYAFPSFYIQKMNNQNIGVIFTNSTPISTDYGGINSYTVSLTTQSSIKGGAIFYLELQGGFTFSQTCVFSNPCAYFETQLNKMYFIVSGDINVGVVYTPQIRISNPYYQSSTKLYVSYFNQLNNFQNGQVLCSQQSTNYIATSNVINIINPTINYFWGFSYSSRIDFVNKLYVTDTTQNPVQYVYNTLTFQFQVSSNIQFYDSFKLVIRVQNSGMIESSISNNLIPKTGTQIFCRDESYAIENRWQIACYNIGQFLSTDTYKISLKVFYEIGHKFDVENSLNFGDIQIYPIDSEGQIINNVVFFNQQRGIPLTSERFETAGSLLTHSRLAIWGHSQVFNVPEPASITGDSSKYFYDQIISTNKQGIEQPASTTQALVFFVNFPTLSDICSDCEDVESTTKQIKMELIYDSNIISYKSNNTDGLLLGQYKTSSNGISNSVLCKESNQCVNYKESVTNFVDYNTKQFYDTAAYSPQYAKYIFRCGSPTGTGAIPEDCLFNGDIEPLHGANSIMIMREVQFKSTFSFTGLSTDSMLDFVFGFKSGTMTCTTLPCTIADSRSTRNKAFIMHAYVINGKLSSSNSDIKYSSLVNYYKNNNGEDTLTFYRLRGLFTGTIPSTSDKVGIFFDSSLQLQFIMNQGQIDTYQNLQIDQLEEEEQNAKAYMFRSDNSYNCLVRYSTLNRTCKMMKGQGKENDNNIWYLNSGVLINLFTQNSYFDIYIPVKTGSASPKYTSLVFFSSTMKVLGVYQVNYNGMYPNTYSNYIDTSYTTEDALSQLGLSLEDDTQSWTYSLDNSYNSVGYYSFSYKSAVLPEIDIGYGSGSSGTNEYGSGLTIVCKGIDFYPDAGMTLGTIDANSGNSIDTTRSCFSFSYRLLFKRTNYVVFCPFDYGLFPSAVTNAAATSGRLIIDITNARLKGLPASFYSDSFTYSLSKRKGKAIALYIDEGTVITPSTNLNSVITPTLQIIYQNYPKSQPFTITITLAKLVQLAPVDSQQGLQNGIRSLKFLFQVTTLDATNLNKQCNVVVGSKAIGPCYLKFEDSKLAVYAIVKSGFVDVTVLSIQLRILQNINSIPNLSNIAVDVYGNTDVSGENWFYGNSVSPTSNFLLLYPGTIFASNLFSTGSRLNSKIKFEFLNLTSNMKGGLATLKMGFTLGLQDASVLFESSNDYIQVDLAWLKYQEDLQCVIYQGTQISSDWQRIQRYGNKLNLFASSAANINNIYLQQTLVCYNVQIYNDNQNKPISISWMEGKQLMQFSTPNFLYSSLNISPVDQLNVTLSRKIGSPMVESDYFFDVYPKTNLTLKSAFYVRFDSFIPPSLNTYSSNVDCYINGQSTICSIVDHRLVMIPISNFHAANSLINLTIKGVSQPSMKLSKIYIATSILGQYNESSQGNYVLDKIPEETIQSFMILKVEQLNSSSNFTNQNDYKIVAQLPYNTINQNIPIYIDMFTSPYYSNGTALKCSMVGNDTYDWVKSCSFTSSKRIEIQIKGTNWNMTSDVLKTYTITLYNIFTFPCYLDSSPSSFGVKILIPFPDKNFIQYQSQLVNQNDIINFNANCSQQIQMTSNSTIPSTTIFQSNFQCLKQLYIPKGYVSEMIYFKLPIGTAFPSTVTLQLNDNMSPYFQISRQIIQLTAEGLISQGFQIGAHMNTSNGQYFLTLKKTQHFNTDYPLLHYSIGIQVYDKQCPTSSIIIPTSVQVPVYGKSQNIKIDFVNCMPVDKLSVSGHIDPINGTYYYTFEQEHITLYGNQSITFIKFIVINVIAPPTPTSTIQFRPVIKWHIIGKNSQSYEGISDIPIISVEQTTVDSDPEVLYLGVSESLDKINATIQCSTQGSAYYMAYQTLYPQTVDRDSIINKTKNGIVEQTILDPLDPSWTIYGYQQLNTENISIAIIPAMVGRQYQINVFCQSLLFKLSIVTTQQMNTSEDSMMNYQLSFHFQTNLNSYQKQQLACVIAQNLSIPLNLIYTDELTICNQTTFDSIFNPVLNTTISNDRVGTSAVKRILQINDPRLNQTQDLLFISKDYSIANRYAQATSIYNRIYKLTIYTQLLTQILSRVTLPELIQDTATLVTQTSDLLANVLTAKYVSMKANASYVEIKLLINYDGFLLFGIEKVSSMKTPNYIQLFYGQNGDNNNLYQSYKLLCTDKQNVIFQVNGLEKNIEYVLYWSGAPQNPSIYSINSGITRKFFISMYEDKLSSAKLKFALIILWICIIY